MKKWNLNSWKDFPAKHLPEYQDTKELDLVLSKIRKYPPLVFAGESRSLKKSLAHTISKPLLMKPKSNPPQPEKRSIRYLGRVFIIL